MVRLLEEEMSMCFDTDMARSGRLWFCFLVAVAACGNHARGEDRAQSEAVLADTTRGVRWWKGTVQIPGQVLDFAVVFRATDVDQFRARIDIPIQGVTGLELEDVVLTDSEMNFSLPAPSNAKFEIALAPSGLVGVGKMFQNGLAYSVNVNRISEAEAKEVGPKRPQNPKPPFPYGQREVTYQNAKDGTTLAGTLTIPPGKGPHPAVILITGSGAQDRDESVMGHRPFAVIADYLSRHGIAVLRSDDRGVGGSSGSVPLSTAADFAEDVRAGINFLRQQPEIDKARIGLLGHSEGGIIASMVAADSDQVACIVTLAGPAFPGTRILNMQMEALLRAAGKSEDEIKRHTDIHMRLLNRVVSGASEDSRRESMRELVVHERTMQGSPPLSDETVDAIADQQMKMLSTPWMSSFLKYDPREALRKVRCPVLALVGSLDLQVPADANLKEMETVLREAGNNNVTTEKLDGLNHLFQEAKTGRVAEYGTISQTISPSVLDKVTNWLRAQFKLGG